jgi:hypothetical protein
VVGLARFLRPDALKLLKERVVREVYDGDASESEFFLGDSFDVTDGEICLRTGGLSFHFDQYVVASYAAGPQEIVVEGEDWKKYFEVNDITKTLF